MLDSLEAVSVLQVEHQAVSTQVYFVLGLRHLQVKQTQFEHKGDFVGADSRVDTGNRSHDPTVHTVQRALT